MVNQSLVLRINPPRRMVKIATFACPETVMRSLENRSDTENN
jgi:hypothetical protein